MLLRGDFRKRNLRQNEKVKDGLSRNNIHDSPKNTGQVQCITINGVEYFVRKVDSPFCGDNSLNSFNNKTVDVEGVFIGSVLIISSIEKV